MSKNIYEWIPELLEGIDCPVIVEIGANTGTDTVKLAAIPGATVYAFEPEPRCDLSKMPLNVVVNRMAVSDATGEAVFNLSDAVGYNTPEKAWTYSSSLLKPKNHLTMHPHVKFVKQIKVKTTRLDDYCVEKGITRIDFLWMDVQGAEAKVFTGAAEILKNTRFVYTEYSNDELYAGQQPLNKLIEMLKTYEVMDIWPVEPMNVLMKNKEIGVSRRDADVSRRDAETQGKRETVVGNENIVTNDEQSPELAPLPAPIKGVGIRNRIIRLDDFPSGVRPILNDLSVFFRIFDEFEKRGIYFYLGIVPDAFRKYVKAEDKKRLKNYKYLIPCQHGYDHRYDEMSRKLIAAKDVFNTKTLGCFNEFEKTQKIDVLKRIRKGKRILELFFGRSVNHYIPVCNIIDKTLVKVLRRMNYPYLFTVPSAAKIIEVKTIMTNFSGRMHELNRWTEGCICLHVTWEWDYINEHGWDRWIENFDRAFGNARKDEDEKIKDKSKNIKGERQKEEEERQKTKVERQKKEDSRYSPGELKKSPGEITKSPGEITKSPGEKSPGEIPRIANFYWNAETPLSYLRYLTIVTFRYFHPDWVINMWVSASDTKSITEWATPRNTLRQDFQTTSKGNNYLNNTIGLGVNILQFVDRHCNVLPPNYVSDIARFKTLFNGGWFFDLDQIFTRNFDYLCNYDFVTGVGYMKEYAPNGLINCGVLGASKDSIVPKTINQKQTEILEGGSVKGYNELGNLFLNKCFQEEWYKNLKEKHFISGPEYFYPIETSPEVYLLYQGKIKIAELENNYAVHWYGGHPLSQEFNAKYTEAFARESMDSISVYCRKLGVISGNVPNKKKHEIIFCTSVNPNKESETRQQRAIKSWLAAGIAVFSVNPKTEIKLLKKTYEGVTFLGTDDVVDVSGKMYIKINTMLDFVKKIDCETVCIINSDIELEQNGDLFDQLKLKAKDGMVIARRYNYEKEHKNAKMEAGGIDIFAFPKKHIGIVPKEEYCLGQPVWDYWFPLMFSENNIQIYYVDQPLFYHQIHERKWSRQVWAKNLARIGKHYGWEEKDPGKISMIMFCKFMAKAVMIKANAYYPPYPLKGER